MFADLLLAATRRTAVSCRQRPAIGVWEPWAVQVQGNTRLGHCNHAPSHDDEVPLDPLGLIDLVRGADRQ